MANINKLIPFILRWEGLFVNDPDDAGGATNKGVTLKTYETYCFRKGYPKPTVERLKNIPDSHWTEIIKTMYWDRWKADEIKSQSIANILVDWVWGSGKWGIIIPQRILGVEPDGVVGNITLSALNAREPKELFAAIKAARVNYIDDIIRKRPSNIKFKNGWMNRLNDIKFEE
ncbi:MAG: glycosyl hydrolase 108 family protein [Oscillospiraceae bacterium]|nr:glycosyl hydrolase 108 family protein [Oscillospiraceae bacterium]